MDEMEFTPETVSTLVGEHSSYSIALALATLIEEGEVAFHTVKRTLENIGKSDNETYNYYKEIARKHCL
jgi:hypothetical protein